MKTAPANGENDTRPRLSGKKRLLLVCLIFCLAVPLALLMGEGICRLFGLGAWIVYERGLYRASANPRIAYELTPGYHGWSYGTRVRVNSLGFRGVEIPKTPQEGTFRIVCLGDSGTFGMGVADDETWPYFLATELEAPPPYQRVETVNIGVSGYNLEQYAETIKSRLPELNPHLILICLSSNDLGSSLAARDGYLCFPAVRGSLPIPGKRWLQTHSHFYQYATFKYHCLLRRSAEKKKPESPPSPPLRSSADYERARRLLEECASSAGRMNARLFIAKLNVSEDSPLGTAVSDLTLSCCRLTPFGKNDTLPDGHPNARGYTSMATDIAKALTTLRKES